MENNILPKYVSELLFQIAKDESISEPSIEVLSGSNHCDGYLALMHRVVLNGTQNGGSTKLTLICKIAPDNVFRRAQFNTVKMFEREVFAYKNILTAFEKFQKEKGIAKFNGFFAFPKIYAAVCDASKDHFALIMDDLTERGFQLWDRRIPMDIDHVKLFMIELGKFHAISFALREQEPEIFDKTLAVEDILITHFESKPESMQAMFDICFDLAIKSFNPLLEWEIIQKVRSLKANYLQQLKECVGYKSAGKYGVLNHGDLWGNNLMFSYDREKTSEVSQVFLIDWQISRLGSPAMDISYYIFSSTDQTLRKQYYSELLAIYHQALSKTLTHLGSDPEILFPFAELERQLKLFGRFGVIMSHMLLQLVTVNPKDVPDLDELAEECSVRGPNNVDFFSKTRKSNQYSERIAGVIRDAIHLGYI